MLRSMCMRHLLTALLTFGAWSSSLAESPTILARLELEDGDQIVFLGDSITHQCLYTQYVEDYFYTRFPRLRLQFHNSGVGGARAWDALQRFDRDVAAYKPKYVTVLLGMNDGTYQPFNQEIFDTYTRDMSELIARIKSAGATPILMTPTMFDARAARAGKRQRDPQSVALYNSVLAYYGTWLREVATEQGYGFVDMYSLLNNLTTQQRKSEPDFTLIRDAVHPDAPGQLVMAYAIIESLGLQKPVSNIRLFPGRDGKPTVQATGGTVSDVTMTHETVEFTWLAESLPWVLPEETGVAVDLLKLGHRASREGLEIHGLKPGTYRLTIDAEEVGTYNSMALERHIELQGNARTPQYQQALAVAEKNRERNSGPVRNLRNEWRQFQQLARLKRQAGDTPPEALAEQIKTLETQLEQLDERIRQHEADAKKIEDEIYTMNQPKPRRYRLHRVTPAAAE